MHFDAILDYLEYDDNTQLRNCCHFLHDLTRTRRAHWMLYPMRHYVRDHILHMFLKYSRMKGGLSCLDGGFQLKDNQQQLICKRHLELRCEGRGCMFSHQATVTKPAEIVAQESYLEHMSFLVAANQVFGTKFVWKVEKFLEVLFERYSTVVPLIHRVVKFIVLLFYALNCCLIHLL